MIVFELLDINFSSIYLILIGAFLGIIRLTIINAKNTKGDN